MSGPGLREHRKAANRAAIVKAAIQVFSEMGFEACTVRDIVRASGLAAGTFYNYFQSKEEVLESIIQEISTEVRGVVQRARRGAPDGKSFVEEGYLGFFQVLSSDPGMLLMLARNQNIFRSMVFGAAAGATPAGFATGSGSGKKTSAVEGILEDLKDDLRWAIRQGYFRDQNPDLLARAIIGAGFEILLTMGTDPSMTPEKAAFFLSELFLQGMQPDRA
ncbi:MAG: hypothetical protein CMF59_18300 [Leptospiraceae bacterium]|nr:hypothetical protein [Leptospiraceae bacterium]